ncbi:glycosyltransferase [Streptomyces sp. NPDC001761]
MRVLMFGNALTGHMLPLLPLARAFRQQGHTVSFVSAAGMAGLIEGEGFALLPAGPGMDEVMAKVIRRVGPDLMKGNPAVFAAELFAAERVDLSAEEALAAATAWSPDLVVAEHCDFVGPLVAAVLKVPSVVVAVDPALEPDMLDAMAEAARSRYLERGLEAPVHAFSGDLLVDLCPPSLQRGGALPPLETVALRPEPHRRADGTQPAPRVPGTGRPRVLVSFSTASKESALGPVLRSLSELDVDLVATTGGAPTDGLDVPPGRVELVAFVPAAELFDGVAVVVHHGGSGTTFGTGSRGLPAVVVPGTAGQQRQAFRVQKTGAGLALPIGEQAPEAVTAAVARVLSEPAFAQAARGLRDEIAAMPSASQVAADLTNWVAAW